MSWWIGIVWIVLVLFIIGLGAGMRSASRPQPSEPLNCPAGAIYTPLHELCGQ